MARFEKLCDAVDQAVADHLGGVFGEYKIAPDEYLLVQFNVQRSSRGIQAGLFFEADFEKPTHFSGDVKKWGAGFLIPFDEFSEDIQSYFELLELEITEGYLLPNNLCFEEDF